MKKLVIIAVALAMSMVLLVGCGSTAEKTKKTVATDGSTSMEKVIGSLGEAFEKENPEISFTYNPTGSGSGITAVAEGRCDIGLSSRNLKPEEKKLGLKETVLALDGISVIVNEKNQVKNLSMQQISDIYKGKITDWKQVGGKSGKIVVIGREAGSGTRDGFESITKTEEKCKYRQELTSTGDVIKTVEGNESAIGYASMATVTDTVKQVSVDGTAPSVKTVKDGSYIIQRPFVLVTNKEKELSKTAQDFFNFVTSKDASNIITAAGAVTQK